jgi:hypothetical protein
LEGNALLISRYAYQISRLARFFGFYATKQVSKNRA